MRSHGSLLTRATRGEFQRLAESDGGELDREARQAWARGQLVERIDAEIAKLEEHFVDLDVEKIEQDRAEAGDRVVHPVAEAALGVVTSRRPAGGSFAR